MKLSKKENNLAGEDKRGQCTWDELLESMHNKDPSQVATLCPEPELCHPLPGLGAPGRQLTHHSPHP